MIDEIDSTELLKFKYVVDIIKEQMNAVRMTDPEFYSNYVFDIENEQYFVPDEEREPNRIYIVIKFSPAQIDYGQDIMPFTIQAVSEQNGLIAAQRLLFDYAQTFNLRTLLKDGKTIYQNYTSPNVISNFEVVYDGFRSVLIMSGTILISSNINRITLKYYDGDYALLDFPSEVESLPLTHSDDYVYYNNAIYKWNGSQYVVWDYSSRIYADIGLHDETVPIDMFELPDESKIYVWDGEKYAESSGDEIDILNFTDTFDASPNTQPYFETKNFTDSIIKYGTYSFNVTSFLVNNEINNKVLRILSRKKAINNNFYFKVKFDNGLNMPLLKYKLINATKQQNKGEMPTIVLAFTN